jgi:hypothetical protein
VQRLVPQCKWMFMPAESGSNLLRPKRPRDNPR